MRGRFVYVTLDNVTSLLYNTPPDKITECEKEIRRVIIDPLSYAIRQDFVVSGLASGAPPSEAPDYIRQYDETGLGVWKHLVQDITTRYGIHRLIGFHPEEVEALGNFVRSQRKEESATIPSLLDVVKKRRVKRFIPFYGMEETDSYCMTDVLDIVRQQLNPNDTVYQMSDSITALDIDDRPYERIAEYGSKADSLWG